MADARASLMGLWLAGQHGLAGLQAFMAANWLAFGAGQVLVAASGVLPASMIALMAGATYGLGWGLLLSAISTMVGGWLAFALCRTALRERIARYVGHHPRVARLDEAMTSEGWRLVLLLRVSPVMPFALTSYGLGLTRISSRDFLLGTLASLPALTGYVALGALGRQGMAVAQGGASIWHWLMLAGGLAVVLYALARVRAALGRVGAA
ncbi:MAG TPA: VTT domain-containing protein [Novosphingobium sp.]|nr:VTT domain-containing protein [Novosphingobium sp.]